MAKVRKILRHPSKARRNFFVVDASFLAEKYIPVGAHPIPEGRERGRECKKWWKEIDRQIKLELARVYVPDVCIAEAFKVLAKKYYQDKVLKNSSQYKYARKRLSADITLSHKALKQQKRYVPYHDMESSRDIIIAVDRFYELFLKQKKSVGIVRPDPGRHGQVPHGFSRRPSFSTTRHHAGQAAMAGHEEDQRASQRL